VQGRTFPACDLGSTD